VRREVEGDNVLLLAELFKLGREVALMVVKDDHAIYILPPYACMPVEVLNPVYSCLVVCPAVRGGFNNLGRREVSVGVSGDKVVFALYD